MATAKARRGIRRWKWPALLVAAAFALAYWSVHSWLRGEVTTATAYGARVACTCHFIGGQELSQCRSGFEPGMRLVMLSGDEAGRSVTARIPLLSSQTASYRPGWGCILDPWED